MCPVLGLVTALALGCAPIVSAPTLDEPVMSEPEPVVSEPEPTNSPGDAGVIKGLVENSLTEEPFENALVVLMCMCLAAPQERFTNERGMYSFKDLPAGNYTVQVLAGQANVSKVTELPHGAKFKANFTINPEQDGYIGCGLATEHRSIPIYLRTTAGNSLRDAFEASYP